LTVKIGCCGFPVSRPRYFEELCLVEVNATFYKYVKPSLLSKWRREAPPKFEFTVKAHQDISHVYKLDPKPECIQAFNQMAEACRILDSRVMLIQTPGSFKPTSTNIAQAKRFFGKVNRKELTLVWETRGAEWENPPTPNTVGRMLRELGVVHVTDPLLTQPFYVGRLAYFRLHGLGRRLYYYQYSDEELRRLETKLRKIDQKRDIYVLFNNLTMFTDAVRFKGLIQSAKVPSLTGCFGLESLRAVVEKARFPAPRSTLIKAHGWKLFDLAPGKQDTVGSVLEKVPDGSYGSLESLLKVAKKFVG